MQQLQGREFSVEQEISLQFTESSWNGFMRILFQIPAEVKKQLPIDPRTSDPRTTLQKILESDIWAIKEGNNLLLLSRCFVLPCTLVRKDAGSILRVHSCRQTSDGDAVTAFNEGVLIKAVWVILLPEDTFVSTKAAESLYSFFFPEESVPEIHQKSEKPAQPAQSAAPPVADVAIERAIVQQPWAEKTVKIPPEASAIESRPAFNEFISSATPSVSATSAVPIASTVPAAEQKHVFNTEAAASPAVAEQKHVLSIDAAQSAANAIPGFESNTQSVPQFVSNSEPKPAASYANWNNGTVQASGQPAEKLNFNLSGGDLSNAVPELEQGESLFSLGSKVNSAAAGPGSTFSETVGAQTVNYEADSPEPHVVNFKVSEGYTLEGSLPQDMVDKFLKKPGSSTSEVVASSVGSAKNDLMNDADKNSAPPAVGNRISAWNSKSSSSAPLTQSTIDAILAQLNANSGGNDPNPANSQSQPFARPELPIQDTTVQFQRNVMPVQPLSQQTPPQQKPQPFISQPVNRTMPEPSVSRPVLGTPSLGQQDQPMIQSNRMGMAMSQPVDAAKTAAPQMAGSAKGEGEPLMSQNQIDALISSLKGGQ